MMMDRFRTVTAAERHLYVRAFQLAAAKSGDERSLSYSPAVGQRAVTRD
jgi:hypothetical protein